MTRNLKAFGLALVAMAAFGAFAAQGASAGVSTHSFQSEVNSTVLTGQNESYGTNSSRHVFTATGGLTVSCDGTFSKTITDTEVDTVTLHPKYSNCTSSLGGSPVVHTGGCNYIFDSDTTTNTHPSGDHAPVTLECESAHSASPHFIEITAAGCHFRFAVTHAAGQTVNQSLHGVTYTNLDSDGHTGHEKESGHSAITVNATVRTISYIATSGSLCGLAGHPAGTYTNGSLDGLATVTGYEDSEPIGGSTTTGFTWGTHSEGNQVDVWVSGTT